MNNLKDIQALVDNYCCKQTPNLESAIRTCTKSENVLLQKTTSYFFSKSGKYFRALLTLLSCEVVGRQPVDVMDAACAIELVHSSSLIFDDLPCMDNSDTRRGQMSLHKRFSEAEAILTALFFLNKSYELILKHKNYSQKSMQILNECIGETGLIVGQLMDLRGNYNLNVVNQYKTVPLIRAAVQLGACTGLPTENEENAMIKYAELSGMAFQVRDDIIDGREPTSSQEKANTYAYEASKEIRSAFGNSTTALTLAGMAIYASERNE